MKEYKIANGSTRIGYIDRNQFNVYEREWYQDHFNINDYTLKSLKFNISIYKRLKKALSVFEDYNKLGKRMFGKNFYMTEECLEQSPSKLFENLVEKKCYMVVKIPKVICRIYSSSTTHIVNKLTAPINDMYMYMGFSLDFRQINNFTLCTDSSILGFQGGFDSKRPMLFPHLSGQNNKFCLGSSELSTLTYLLSRTDMIDNPTIDILEHIFNYFEIYLGCQSNEGGPYTHMENALYTSSSSNNQTYYSKLLEIYFLCIPESEWAIMSSNVFVDKKEYCGIAYEIMLTDIDCMLDQLSNILPEKYKLYIDVPKYSLKKPESFNPRGVEKSSFRFHNNKITTIQVDNPITDFYINEEQNKPIFLSKKFKEEFLQYLNNRLQQQNSVICENY